jgi:5-amino-6-(5-phosphoribosylamino)uracil reductase
MISTQTIFAMSGLGDRTNVKLKYTINFYKLLTFALSKNNRPDTTAILAMTADGKITDYQRSAARFGSTNDKAHLEEQVSLADGVLFGAGTLRAYGTTISVTNYKLLQARIERSQFPQPVQIVVSASGNLDPKWRFFQQPIPRWLLTLPDGAKLWQGKSEFERILVSNKIQQGRSIVDWRSLFGQFPELGLNKLAILGGSQLLTSLLTLDLIDELWLTICPTIFGGDAPTPVEGIGFPQSQAKRLTLVEVKQIQQEVFLHYLVNKNNN